MRVSVRERSSAAVELLPWRPGWMCVLVLLAVFVAHSPALSGGFLWDDQPGHVTRPELRSLDGLRRIWFDVGATQQYYPLLHSAFWVEHTLWGDTPTGYHLLNLLLHAMAACLLARVMRQLAIPGSGMAALLFALHPVTVESVAWISEQKNTLSAVLYFLSASAFLRFTADRRPATYGWATFLFVLALLTKTVTATLPAALLVLLWWRQGGLSWRRDWVPLLPWLGLGAIGGLVTASVEHALIGAQGADFESGAVARVMLSGHVVWFYLGKLAWPAALSFVYPKWVINTSDAARYLPVIAMVLVLVLCWRARRRRPGVLAAVLLFGGLLFPVLGFVNVFPFMYSYVADHFQYLACTAIFAWVSAGLTGTEAVTLGAKRVAAALGLLALAVLTWQQSGTYRDVFTLYRATLARNPAAWMAHNNLGIALVDAGRAAEALPHYEDALRLRPNYAEGENNLGYALLALGRNADALPHLRRAITLQPKYAEAHNNLGRALMAADQPEAGKSAFAEALRINPRYTIAHVNLGLALATGGDAASALSHFAQAAALDPNYADAFLNWGTALTVLGRATEALPKFETALRLRPEFAPNHVSYGRGLAAAGRMDEAIAAYRHAIQIAPDYAQAHLSLALALQQTGRTADAMKHFAEARRLGLAPP
jgi:protein O-mannosyl-transferase